MKEHTAQKYLCYIICCTYIYNARIKIYIDPTDQKFITQHFPGLINSIFLNCVIQVYLVDGLYSDFYLIPVKSNGNSTIVNGIKIGNWSLIYSCVSSPLSPTVVLPHSMFCLFVMKYQMLRATLLFVVTIWQHCVNLQLRTFMVFAIAHSNISLVTNRNNISKSGAHHTSPQNAYEHACSGRWTRINSKVHG